MSIPRICAALAFATFIQTTSTVPIEQNNLSLDSSHASNFDRLINSVSRVIGENDIIFPSVCPPACEHLHRAMTVSNYTDQKKNCSCICPPTHPAYLSSTGACVGKLSECANTIRWNLDSYKHSNIPVVQLKEHSIILPNADLDFDGSSLVHVNQQHELENISWRIETAFLFIVIVTIIIILVVTFIVWNVCWSIKKRKLISDFQRQFVQQYKNRNNQAQGLSLSTKLQDLEEIEVKDSNYSQSFSRKRLIFSTAPVDFAEYFNHDQMAQPSPLAEQFLCDLRRVVDYARERIRQRRFSPTLSVISEEDNMYEQLEGITYQEEEEERDINASPQYSPQSEQKSIDSGRESRENSDDDTDEKQVETFDVTNVAAIVKSFEKSAPRPSYVPIMLNSSMRKTNVQKMTFASEAIPSEKATRAPIGATTRNDQQRQIRAPVDISCIKDRRKYAVFPSDGMFNKSLPRRSKRNVSE